MGFLQRASSARSSWTGPFTLNPQSGKYKDPVLNRLFGAGSLADSGIVVTPQNAMMFSAVYAAVNMIASDVAKLPLNLLKRRKDGGSDHYVESKLYDLLKTEPNEETGAMVQRRTILAHALTCHGGYAEVQRDQVSRPTGLWLLTPDRVQQVRRGDELVFRIDGRDDQIIPHKDMIHIHGLGYDDTAGYEVINLARQCIGVALAAERFGGQFFGRGTVIGGVLESQEDLDEDQKKEIRDAINEFRKSQDTAFRILVTGAGQKFTQFQNRPGDSQMNETIVSQVEAVARFFRIPPVKMGVNRPGAVSYASVEAQNTDYYVGALLDWITLVEQEYNRKLIPRSERRIQYIKHNANAFLRADTQSRSKFYEAMLDRGVFNADIVLDLEDMNPQPDGLGQMYLVQGAQVPKHQIEKINEAKIKAAEAKSLPASPEPSTVRIAIPEAFRSVLIAAPEAGMGYQLADIGFIDGRSLLGVHVFNCEAFDAPADYAGAVVASVTPRAADDTRARLVAAESALVEARTQLATERTARVAAEATGQATAEELATRRATEAESASIVSRLTMVVEELRADVALRSQEAAERSQEITTLSASLADARVGLEAAQARVSEVQRSLEGAEARSVEVIAARDAAQTRLDALEVSARAAEADQQAMTSALEAAREQLAQAQALAAQSGHEASELSAEVIESRRQRDEARARIDELESRARILEDAQGARVAELESARGELSETVARADVATQEVTQLTAAVSAARTAQEAAEASVSRLAAQIEELQSHLSDLSTRADAAEAQHAEATEALALRETALTERQSTVDELQRQLAEAEAARQALESTLAQGREATRARLVATIGAHRGLIVDAMGRMTRREAAQARMKQATPAKLRRWLEDFSSTQIAMCAEALVPAMRVHLAWKGVTDDPIEAARAIASEHVGQFKARLRDVLDGPVEEFHAELEAVLTRWESSRAEIVADAVLAEEIRHAGR